jgi:phosphoenolpyruvate carboxylase
MSFLIPNQLVFNSSRHTALFLLLELYHTIQIRLSSEAELEIQNIISNLLNSDPTKLKIISENPKDHSAVRFIKFYLEFNHIAERFHRIYLNKEKHVVPKLISEFQALRPNISDSAFESFLNEIEIDLVFTAHPTEIYERKVLKKYIEINKNLKQLLDLNDFNDQSQISKDRKSVLLSLWLSPDFGAVRPKPKDEAKLAQLVFQYSLWTGITTFKKTFYNQLKDLRLPLTSNKNVLKFSSWMGGDRDGNPNVTAKTTSDIVRSFAKKSLNLYFRELKRLKEDLSFDIELNNKVIHVESILEEAQDIIANIIHNDYDIDLILESEKKILDSLNKLYSALIEYKAKFLADRRLRSMIDRLESLGLLGMRWDIRQESAHHDNMFDEIFESSLESKKFSEMNEPERLKWLDKIGPKIKEQFKTSESSSALSFEAKDFIETIHVIKKLGEIFIPYYIISMTRSASDLLLIQKIFQSFEIKTQVVPLFETLEDLDNSPEIMDAFLEQCKNSLKAQKNIPIMLGYSDSAKTGSRIASVWNLYLAQKKLVAVAKKMGFECHFFHGRGGSIGRGGGPVQHAIASCPIESVSKGFRMTIQGEVIFDRFGFSSLAAQTMMTYVLSLINYKFSERKDPKNLESYEKIFSELSETSKNKYRELIDADHFYDYFEQVTPVNFMSDLNIGSRPSKRQTGKKSYRAIPWIFGWTQNRCLLPAWYGAGTALESAVKTHSLEKLQDLYGSFFLFRSTLDLIYMTYLKVEMDVFKKYDEKLAKGKSFNPEIQTEFELLKKYLLMIVDPKKINHLNLEEKLFGRLEVLDYLHDLQIKQLEKNQENPDSFSEDDKKTLLLTIQALASGMGNTG